MKVIPYKMFCPIKNLGDAINPYVIKAVSGEEPLYQRSGKHLLGIGSIFFYANKNSYIWGSGVIRPSQEIRPLVSSQIKAVRGELTRNFLIGKGYSLENLPLGDPGYLVKEIYPFSKVEKKYKVCVIPHHASYKSKDFDKFKNREDVCFFNIMTNDVNELDKIAASEVVVSQSLHGLIFAEAFGIPSVWVSNRIDSGWGFKFLDWYSTTNEPWEKPIPLSASFNEIISEARLSHSKIDLEELKKSFPKNELLTDFNEKFTPYDACVKADFLRENYDFGFGVLDYAKVGNDFLEGIGDRLEKCKNEMGFFSAPPYVVVGDKVSEIKKIEIDKIIDIMNGKLKFYFATIVRGVKPPKDEKVYKQNGVFFAKNKYLGGCFVIRPGRDADLVGKEFLTFYLS